MEEPTPTHPTRTARLDVPPCAESAFIDEPELRSVPLTIHSQRSTEGFLIAVNTRGILAAMPRCLPTDALVEVEFATPSHDRCLRVAGEVRWSRIYVAANGVGFNGVGVEFFGLDAPALTFLREFLAAHHAQPCWSDDVFAPDPFHDHRPAS